MVGVNGPYWVSMWKCPCYTTEGAPHGAHELVILVSDVLFLLESRNDVLHASQKCSHP